MNTTAIILFIALNFIPVSPEGVWVYKQDLSRIEINTIKGKLSAYLISTNNPFKKPGTEILKDFIYRDGKWNGKLYLTSKDRWVEANLEQKHNLLIIELDLGFEIKKIHWYKEKIVF